MGQDSRKTRIPTQVLELARRATAVPKPPSVPEQAKPSKHPREKIVAALRKLHPMD